jgi:hypothetical protein
MQPNLTKSIQQWLQQVVFALVELVFRQKIESLSDNSDSDTDAGDVSDEQILLGRLANRNILYLISYGTSIPSFYYETMFFVVIFYRQSIPPLTAAYATIASSHILYV